MEWYDTMPRTHVQDGYMPDGSTTLQTRKPKLYAVVMHNDDYTTMDFVVDILKKIFHKNMTEATEIMFDIHNNGSRVVAVYTYDIAVTKTNMAVSMASDRGFPLMVTVKEADE